MVKEIILSATINGIAKWAVLLLLLASCTTTRYEHVQYPCPPKPVLAKIASTELASLTDETYAKLVRREMALRAYARLLEVHCAKREL